MGQQVSIGVLSPVVGGHYHGGIIAGIARAAGAVGAKVIAVQTLPAGLATGERGTPDLPKLGHFTSLANVDGWIVMPTAARPESIEELARRGKPLVTVSTPLAAYPVATVLPDNAAGIHEAVAHLLAHGHTRIAFVGRLVQNDIRERYDAYCGALRQAGLAPLLFEIGDNNETGGQDGAAQMLAAGLPATASIAATDMNALGVVQALVAARVNVPADHAVIGFDDTEQAARRSPRLTSVNQQYHRIGDVVAQLLLRAIAGEHVEPALYRSPTHLVVRESCGCLPALVGAPINDDRDAATALCVDLEEALAPPGVLPEVSKSARVMQLAASLAGLVTGRVPDPTGTATTAVVRELYALGPRHDSAMQIARAVKAFADRTVRSDPTIETVAVTLIYERVIAASTALADAEASERFATNDTLQRALRDQYEVGMDLLRSAEEDPRDLEWLRATGTRAACFGLWREGDDDDGSLRITGAFDETGPRADITGTVARVESFPPQALLERLRPDTGEVAFVIPVRVQSSDWGLLSVIGAVDAESRTGRETLNYWCALLALSLDQDEMLTSLRRQREQLTHSYHRQQALTEEIGEREKRYALASAAASDGLWDWDLVADRVYSSARLRAILGHEEKSYSSNGEEFFAMVHPDDVAGLRSVIATGTEGDTHRIEYEHRMRTVDASYIWVVSRAIDVRGPEGDVVRVVGSLTDITARKQLEEQLRHGALYDAITGLPNRTLFVDRLQRAVAHANRSSTYHFVVLFLDLDGFKVVNDSLGHGIGDLLLAQVGERLSHVLRDGDTGARFGGDEFAILLPGVEVRDVAPVVERLQTALAAPFDIDGHHVVIGASVGVAGSATGYDNAEDVIRDADIAMYRAKSYERGTHAVFDVRMHEGAVVRLRTELELRQAIELGQLEVHYQPIVELDTGRVARLESLLRWRHPTRGLLPPRDFLPVAEESGLMIRIGQWAIRESCQQLATWRANGTCDPDLRVSVNVSHREFWHGGLLEHVSTSLDAAGLAPEFLTLEITEGVIMDNPELALRTLGHLRETGVRLHIDDFGTGYSSLQSLHRFPIDALKIDQSFVADIGRDSRSTELIRIILMMGSNLGVNVIAEGIERPDQRDALLALGCVQGQGHWFSGALSGDEVEWLLQRRLPVAATDPAAPVAPGVPAAHAIA